MNTVAKTESNIAPITQAPTDMIQLIERALSNPNVDPDKLDKMLDVFQRVKDERAKVAFNTDLAAMQPNLPVIAEKGSGHGDITYAKWEDINEAILPVLSEYGFALTFRIGDVAEGMMTITAVLSHRDGHEIETGAPFPKDSSGSKNDIQGWGSTISYGKRYTAGTLLNIQSRLPGDRDDDGASVYRKVDEVQLEMLTDLAAEVGADETKFCAAHNVEKFEDIHEDKFKGAMDRLREYGASK